MHGNEIRSRQKNVSHDQERKRAKEEKKKETKQKGRKKKEKERKRGERKNREFVAQGEKSKLILYEPTQAFEFGKIRCLD